MSVSPPLDLERLFREHWDTLLNMLRRMVGCPATAADLAQEAFVRLADIPQARVISSPRAFLFRIAANLALDHFRMENRRNRCRVSIEEVEKVVSDEPPIDRQLHDKQRVAALEKVLAGLSPRTQTIFVLRRVYGYSYREIARQLGVSERTVERQLVNAMARCQARLPDESGFPGGPASTMP
jgi:RNA polymerase sigma factor (sigma-70 family)